MFYQICIYDEKKSAQGSRKKPTRERRSPRERPVLIDFARLAPIDILYRRSMSMDEINQFACLMEGTDCCKTTLHKISIQMIRGFLGHAHAFTAVGLQSQAIGYSHDPRGIVRYLALQPQRNEPDSVSDSSGRKEESEVFQAFVNAEPRKTGVLSARCWILTHPRTRPLMSLDELFQLYLKTRRNRKIFVVVLFPSVAGVKALCFH